MYMHHPIFYDLPADDNHPQVMDFSAAQRGAHAQEYAEIAISLMPSFANLLEQSQKIECDRYVSEAREAELGCNIHFWCSATHLKANGALVPTGLVNTFDNFLRQLQSPDMTHPVFDETVRSLKSTFPKIHGWLNWWLRPTIASMIFPVKSVVDPFLASQVPSTSNPVEHQHSLLHHATGTDQDLLPGIEKMYLHVQELEAQYNAIDGTFSCLSYMNILMFTLGF